MPYSQLADIERLNLSSDLTCDNPYALLTMDNDVVFLGNVLAVNYKSDSVMFTLPENMRPMEDIVEPVYVGSDIAPLTLTSDGDVKIGSDVNGEMVYIGGTKINVSGRYYNQNIGNVDKSGFSSPLNWEG